MNKQQRSLVINSLTVIAVTAAFIFAMINLKDWLNKSEAMRAMQYVGQQVLDYRNKNGSLPPETYLAPVKQQLLRLGQLCYRAQWVDYDSGPETILAYSRKDYRSLLVSSGYVILRLDGRVEWMESNEFEELLQRQQSQREIQMLQQQLQQRF